MWLMGAVSRENRNIDMICQHNCDGTIIPMKIRMEDDDGMVQEYRIRSYKDMSHSPGSFELPDAGHVHSSGIYPFECKIESFGREQVLHLFYNSYEHTWKLAPNTSLAHAK